MQQHPKVTRFSFQHRAYYCYIVMSLWIFILVAGMYRYVGNEEKAKIEPKRNKDNHFFSVIKENCNPHADMSVGDEGISDEDTWTLHGVIMVVRHGDRGPLTHVRNGENLRCNIMETTSLFKQYQSYLWNSSLNGKSSWVQNPGPFHNFPSLPFLDNKVMCPLGQLTYSGVEQALKTGLLLRKVYAEKLGWSESMEAYGKLTSKQINIIVHSTRYRRTFQTALALLWSLLPLHIFPAVASTIKESPSVMFCYHHCVCPAAETYNKRISWEEQSRLQTHPLALKLIKDMTSIVHDSPQNHDAYVLQDALLAYICHDAPLPCNHIVPEVKNKLIHQRKLMDSEIELDIDYNNLLQKLKMRKAELKPKAFLDFDSQMEIEKMQYFQEKFIDDEDTDLGEPDQRQQSKHVCVTEDIVQALFSYFNWNVNEHRKSRTTQMKATLNGYGLLHNIVKNFIRIISDSKPKFVLYSGHDKTLHALTLALGLHNVEIKLTYLTRLILEVYQKTPSLFDYENNEKRHAIAQDYYFRVILNGVDVTSHLACCRSKTLIVQDKRYEMKKSYLCPVESIVRFVHDDYFSIFNATNFKEACSLT